MPEGDEVPGERIPRRLWWALTAMLAAAAMDLIDTTIVNVALPEIRADLGASTAQVEWSVAAYALTFGIGLITGARMGDRYGRRPVFLAGVAGFLLASLACGLAPGPGVLIAARVAQGAAAAVMIPQILTVIQVAVPVGQRSKAFAAYGATAAIGTVSGPLLGGVLVTADLFGLGWRSIFLINVPIGLAALAVAAVTLPDSRAPRADRPDPTGMALLTAGLLLLLYPLVQGPQQDWPWWAVLALAAAMPVFGLFVAHQRHRERRSASPLVPLSLFAHRGFTGGVCAQVALYAGVTGFFFVLAIALQSGQGYTALRTGLTFVAWSAGIAVASGAAGALASFPGRRRAIAGALVMALGVSGLVLAVSLSGPAIGPWALVPGLFVAGVGMGLVAPTLVDVSLRDVDTAHAGSASGVVSTAGQLGGAFGVAGLGAAFFGTLGAAGSGDHTNALVTVLYCEVAVFVLAAALMFLLPKPGAAPVP
ncbi:EmrB/QacA subfamily drug resistance transporter [Saccharothrix tamanrassetensis]|uniref:EmrB/QacA subfamily drug resistance transporter n=1 Tax=Saccharothrix tamanrassetensis TaxID=1051531 RepID=A0A841C5E7_9PSEU|nr:MFS transporter [Saccharothrix tamanrassetensis]MBB5953752.1 EmrB/QacA subfamily drug resistance transporter [Saccharothrix tamanrassetensis]